MDFIEQIAEAKAASISALGDREPDDFALIIASPVMIAYSDTWREFGHRDRRRIKRELRNAAQRVRAGTYKFAEPPADAPVLEMGGIESVEINWMCGV